MEYEWLTPRRIWIVFLIAVCLGMPPLSRAGTRLEDCDPEMMGFELVTGYVFTAPDDLLDSIPGTIMLTDCLEACQSNETCHSVNYETGLCVLFTSNADYYPGKKTFVCNINSRFRCCRRRSVELIIITQYRLLLNQIKIHFFTFFIYLIIQVYAS